VASFLLNPWSPDNTRQLGLPTNPDYLDPYGSWNSGTEIFTHHLFVWNVSGLHLALAEGSEVVVAIQARNTPFANGELHLVGSDAAPSTGVFANWAMGGGDTLPTPGFPYNGFGVSITMQED